MTVRAVGFDMSVLVEADALETYVTRMEGGGDFTEMYIPWEDAVALRDMLTEQISLYQKDMTGEQEGEE